MDGGLKMIDVIKKLASEKNKETFKDINAGLTDTTFVIFCACIVCYVAYLMLEAYTFFVGSLPPATDIIAGIVLIIFALCLLYGLGDYMKDVGKRIREEHGWRSKDD